MRMAGILPQMAGAASFHRLLGMERSLELLED
jgi:hypothetical protein